MFENFRCCFGQSQATVAKLMVTERVSVSLSAKNSLVVCVSVVQNFCKKISNAVQSGSTKRKYEQFNYVLRKMDS